MFLEQLILINDTEGVTTSDQLTNLEFIISIVIPIFCLIKVWYFNTSRDIYTLGLSGDIFQGTLNTVENIIKNTRTKLYRQRLVSSQDGITNSQSS